VLAGARRSGTNFSVSVRNKTTRGRVAYLTVRPGQDVRDVAYSLALTVSK
jgi:hypothetical protein